MTVIPMRPPVVAAPPPAAPVRRRDLLKMLCQCIGLASIFLVMNYGDLLGGGADVRMHVPFPLVGICLAQIADILLLGVVIFVILAPLQRTRYYAFVRLLLAVVIPPYILWQLQDLMPLAIRDGLPAFYVLWTLLVLLLYFKFNRSYRRLMRLGDALGVFLAVFAVSSIAQLLWITHWRPGPYQKTAAWQSPAQPPREHPRVIWIVFDELSFDQLFEHRAHDLALPSFDALRAESTLFTNVQPVGLKTVKIIPSLLTGRPVTDFRFRFNNQFKVRFEGAGSGQYITGRQTIFYDAQQQGFRTAVVGWYNPYCTIYGDALDSCYFMNLDRIDGLMSQRDSFWRNTYSPLQQMVREIKAPARADRDICTYDVRQRLKTHLDLQQHAQAVLANDQGRPRVAALRRCRTAPISGRASRTATPSSATAPTWTTWRWRTACLAG